MSIVLSMDEGWMVSHVQYINKIYQKVITESGVKNLRFNDTIFNITSQYLRQNQIDKVLKEDEVGPKMKKRKRSNVASVNLGGDILQQNTLVQSRAKVIIDQAKKLNLFDEDVVSDCNKSSLLASKEFYLQSASTEPTQDYQGSNSKDDAFVGVFQSQRYVFPNNCKFYCYDVERVMEKLDADKDKFDCVLMDPPWWNKSIRRKKRKFIESSYKMMRSEEICEIPIRNILKTNGIVAVWCTNNASNLNSILNEFFPSWGVTFLANWYWLKVTKKGDPICDFDDTHGKQPYEQIILGTVSPNNCIKLPTDKIIVSVPSAFNSHKPPLTEILKQYLPEKPECIEIFARYLLPNWTSWGLEVLKFQHFSLFNDVTENE